MLLFSFIFINKHYKDTLLIRKHLYKCVIQCILPSKHQELRSFRKGRESPLPHIKDMRKKVRTCRCRKKIFLHVALELRKFQTRKRDIQLQNHLQILMIEVLTYNLMFNKAVDDWIYCFLPFMKFNCFVG